MKESALKYCLLIWLSFFFTVTSFCQNSLLVNVGSNGCAVPTAPIFSLIKDPLSASPTELTNCNMTLQLPSYYFVFIAYNPSDNKIYINDTRNSDISKLWMLDMGLPGNIACPAVIPTEPTYTLNYSINNFEFDNSGKLWAIANYDPALGQCSIIQYEITTGSVISSKTLQFPTGNFPSDIGAGDLAILPNGRLFATLGREPSRLYEITNYNGGAGNATAMHLQSMPSNTFGIAYLNGQLEITGTNSVDSCYYFDYNISENILGEKKLFQNGQAPIDNTSISPVIGITKQITSAVKVNNNTADIVYEVYVKNMGNAIIQNINIVDDLGKVFGPSNVSNVSANLVAGYNAPGLTLNSGYNGITNTNVLNTGQNLVNQTSSSENYFFKVEIKCRVTNLQTNIIYYNSAISTGNIGAGASLLNTTDSSNNGAATLIDPNNNGIANELGENVPTPFNWAAIVPVKFINATADLINNTSILIKWQIATPVINANRFEIEYSTNGSAWKLLSQINITDIHQRFYQTEHQQIPTGTLYCRIKQIDNNGLFTYSKIIMSGTNFKNSISFFPNPANNYIKIDRGNSSGGKIQVEILNTFGQKLLSKKINTSSEELSTTHLPNGSYILKLMDPAEVKTYKIIIQH